MQFRAEFTPKPFEIKIKHTDKIMLIGSCFTENIGAKLAQHQFEIIENPNGILFNPISIAQAIHGYIENKQYTQNDLFFANEIWNSWNHHTRFSAVESETALHGINQSQRVAHQFLKQADWIMITLGSAFAYKHTGAVVANCHKIPIDKFEKKLLSVDEVISTLDTLMHRVKNFNPNAKFIFTISPVRHLRDGFVENNRSKATLIQAVHHMVDKFEGLFYFPAYELIIDDLRDYRFFAEDLAHPNYAATNYVWEKMKACCIHEDALAIMENINELNAAMAHKPFNETSAAHIAFKQKYLQKAKALQVQLPYVNFDAYLAHFN
jgi:hypothetical protein